MITTIGITLFVMRIVLAEMGKEDFGVFSVLGAAGALLMILSDSLVGAASRHLAFEIGRKDERAVAALFNTSLIVFTALSAAIILLGVALAYPLVSILDIPEGREGVARAVFIATGFTLGATTFEAAFQAVLTARQRHVILAGFGLSKVLLRLVAALMLTYFSGDALAQYPWLLAGAMLIHAGFVAIVVMRVAPESRPRPRLFCRREVGRIASFASWSMLSNISWRIRMQGAAILINLGFGPALNAAYAVAIQIATIQNSAAFTITRALNPAITSRHAAGNTSAVHTLCVVAGKYSFLLTLFYILPLLFEAPIILALWLGEGRVPEHAVPLTRLVATWTCMFTLGQGLIAAINATGTLRTITLATLVLDGAALVLAAGALFLFGAPPEAVPIATMIVVIGQLAARAYVVRALLGLPIMRWVRGGIVPCAVATIAGAIGPAILATTMQPGLARLAASAGTAWVALVPVIWFACLDAEERGHFTRMVRNVARKAGLASPSGNTGGSTTEGAGT